MFQTLSVLTSALWPDFTWQDVAFCLIHKIHVVLAEEAALPGTHCDGSDGTWSTEDVDG